MKRIMTTKAGYAVEVEIKKVPAYPGERTIVTLTRDGEGLQLPADLVLDLADEIRALQTLERLEVRELYAGGFQC